MLNNLVFESGEVPLMIFVFVGTLILLIISLKRPFVVKPGRVRLLVLLLFVEIGFVALSVFVASERGQYRIEVIESFGLVSADQVNLSDETIYLEVEGCPFIVEFKSYARGEYAEVRNVMMLIDSDLSRHSFEANPYQPADGQTQTHTVDECIALVGEKITGFLES